jgi:hypothetical protein
MKPVQSAGILNQGAFPGNGHRQEESVESGVVESFADVSTCSENESLLSVWDLAEGCPDLSSFLCRHAPVENHEVPSKSAQPLREVLEVISALCEQDGRPALLERADDVVQDELVAWFFHNECPVDLLNAELRMLIGESEGCLAHDETVIERPARSLALRVDREAHGPQLHFEYRVVAIAPVRRGREADEMTGLDLREHPFK